MKLDGLKGEILEQIKEIEEIGWLMYDKGWAEGSGGNFSVLLSKTSEKNGDFPTGNPLKAYKLNMAFPKINGRYFLVKGSRKRMRDIKKDPEANLCIGYVDDSIFHVVWPKKEINKPTSEITAHLAIQEYNLENRPESPVVLHAHPTELIAASLMSYVTDSKNFTKVLSDHGPNIPIFFPEGIGYLEYILPGSKVLTSKTLALAKQYRLIIWELHGAIISGSTISECFDLMDIADKSAKLWRLTCERSFGKGLNKKQKKEIMESYSGKNDFE